MKLKKRLIIIICISVVVIGALISIVILSYNGNAALSSGLTYLVCDKPNSPLTGYDKVVYDYVSVAAYNFKSPSSVRIISGSYIDDVEDDIKLYLRISAMNGFGATTTGYYYISDGGNWCFEYDDDFVDLFTEYGAEDIAYSSISRCRETDIFNVDLINKMLAKNWE